MIASKLLSARDKKGLVPKRRTGIETLSRTLSGSAGLCPTQSNFVQVGVSGKDSRFLTFLELNQTLQL
jgi:hypothetical protein